MISIRALLVTGVQLALACALAAPVKEPSVPSMVNLRRGALDGTPSSSGIHDGFYYLFWTDGASKANYINLPGGSFKLEWERGNDSGGNLLGGKGWSPGKSDRVIKYSGSYSADRNSYLAVYGTLKSPWMEYYIIEHAGTYSPVSTSQKPAVSIECDGGVYDLAYNVRVYPGLGQGTQQRLFSVRREKRSAGVVNTKCHFDAWLKHFNSGTSNNVRYGEHVEQLVIAEGYMSSGSATITVSEVR